MSAHPYLWATAITLLLFAMANAIHCLRRVSCYDCFFPYGVPFTIYHEGGYAGGAGFDWAGIGFDAGIVLVIAALLGRALQVLSVSRARR
jgi:hypothetical protein